MFAVSVIFPILAVTLYCPTGMRNACVLTLFARPASWPFDFSIKKLAFTGRRPTLLEADSLKLPSTPDEGGGVGGVGVGGVGVGGLGGVGVTVRLKSTSIAL